MREREKHRVLRARRLRRVRNVRCLRSIFCIVTFPTVLRGWEMPLIDPRFVRVISGDTEGCEQSLKFQEHRIFPAAHHIGQYAPGLMIDCMPQPACSRFGPDETPHFIKLGGALWPDADRVSAWTRREQRGVDVLKRGNFFLTPRLQVVGLIRNTRAVSRMPLPFTAMSTTWRRISGMRPRSWYCRRKIRRSHCPF
jgi:hypothetical protein